ncbi:hypothetical protein ACMFMG_006433 [Clarireedia jacksonii]
MECNAFANSRPYTPGPLSIPPPYRTSSRPVRAPATPKKKRKRASAARSASSAVQSGPSIPGSSAVKLKLKLKRETGGDTTAAVSETGDDATAAFSDSGPFLTLNRPTRKWSLTPNMEENPSPTLSAYRQSNPVRPDTTLLSIMSTPPEVIPEQGKSDEELVLNSPPSNRASLSSLLEPPTIATSSSYSTVGIRIQLTTEGTTGRDYGRGYRS